jgi:hypothetical protein
VVLVEGVDYSAGRISSYSGPSLNFNLNPFNHLAQLLYLHPSSSVAFESLRHMVQLAWYLGYMLGCYPVTSLEIGD